MVNALSTCTTCGGTLPSATADCPACARASQHTAVLGGPGALASAGAHDAHTLAPDQRYEVLATLGRGAMGAVYKVRDRELDEVIAIKVLESWGKDPAAAAERFKQELKLARRINHPNVARLFDLFVWRGKLALSQEFIDGRGLDELIQGGPLGPERIQRYLRYLCSALSSAHEMGVIHRDLKPANIIIDLADRPRILDFGIAVLATDVGAKAKGAIVGTPWYMSPEQASGEASLDQRSDIYSLGVVVYEMATGRRPFEGQDLRETLRAHRTQIPQRPSRLRPELPPAFDLVIMRCLEKDPALRYSSARDLYADLQAELQRKDVLHSSGVVPPLAAGAGQRGRALVIEDDAVTRELVAAMLQALGVLAIRAEDGYRGVELAIKEKPDFILLDIRMPVRDGYETLRILKATKATAAIPVVMLTGVTDSDQVVATKAMGAGLFLNKPLDPDVLQLIVERYTPAPGAERFAAAAPAAMPRAHRDGSDP